MNIYLVINIFIVFQVSKISHFISNFYFSFQIKNKTKCRYSANPICFGNYFAEQLANIFAEISANLLVAVIFMIAVISANRIFAEMVAEHSAVPVSAICLPRFGEKN